MGLSRHFLIAAGFVLTASGAHAQASTQIGTLACDVSKGVGMFVVQKQTLSCVFRPDRGKPERIRAPSTSSAWHLAKCRRAI